MMKTKTNTGQPKTSDLQPRTLPALLVIVGPTASGKTALAIELAQKFNGEIVCADSRTVYKYLDIGTAKPTKEERALVPHHLLDVVNPDEPFTVADFKKLANQAIKDIQKRGKLPILAGGSGLYIDSVIYDYQFSPANSRRDSQNPRHLAKDIPAKRSGLGQDTFIIGLDISREELKTRIEKRVSQMIKDGLVDEVEFIHQKFPNSKALDAPGYKAILAYLNDGLSLDEAQALFIKNDLQLAKRQKTWFKRNNSIHWAHNRGQAVDIATTVLNKKQ